MLPTPFKTEWRIIFQRNHRLSQPSKSHTPYDSFIFFSFIVTNDFNDISKFIIMPWVLLHIELIFFTCQTLEFLLAGAVTGLECSTPFPSYRRKREKRMLFLGDTMITGKVRVAKCHQGHLPDHIVANFFLAVSLCLVHLPEREKHGTWCFPGIKMK